MAHSIPSRQLFIDGEWKSPVQGGRLPVINPVTEEVIGYIPSATSHDVELAVKAARAAFTRDNGQYWSRTPGTYRAKFLRLIAAEVIARKAELTKLEALNCGKPLDEGEWDMLEAAANFEYYADLADGLDAKKSVPLKIPVDTFTCEVLKEPIGVVGLVIPWNYPMFMAALKVAPALAAGCTAILKPSEIASVTCLELAAIAKKVGLPAGVLNIVTGTGPEAGSPLVAHPNVDKVSFTGGAATGKSVLRAASEVIKPVTLELGGKSPIIVFEDVDIDKAVEWTMFGVFCTGGQICSATSRLLLQEGIAPEFLQRLVEWMKNIKISDPFESGCRLGPLVNQGQYEKVLKYIATAKEEGSTLLYGGRRPEHLSKGYFLEPTVFVNVSTTSQLWKEEVFGPVLAVRTFKNEEEAIELSNNSEYALAGAVMSTDDQRCQRVAELLQAGTVWINCSQPIFCQAPWGGNKRSGIGRESGEWGLENYMTVKQVTKYISSDPWGWYPRASK